MVSAVPYDAERTDVGGDGTRRGDKQGQHHAEYTILPPVRYNGMLLKTRLKRMLRTVLTC